MNIGQKKSVSDPRGAETIFTVEEESAGLRLDHYLAGRLTNWSRSRIQATIKAGRVQLNGKEPRTSEVVRTGDEIRWEEPHVTACETAEAEDIPLDILYEDNDLIVLNKPAGMVVHPGAGHASGTMVSALLHHCGSLSQIGGVERPGIVHRLDKETSGCLVVAKNDATHTSLTEQFAGREVKKVYLAVVEGVPRKPSGVVDAPMDRHRVHRQKMAIREGGREAVTEYRVVGVAGVLSLIECRPKTGRTHQIRVHLKHLGCPVAGDPVYGRRGKWTRHLLHAWKLSFRHPNTGKEVKFEAPPPEEFRFS